MELQYLHKKAEQALSAGLYKKAHQYLISILAQDKSFADAYFLLAMIASAHQNISKAIELIKQAHELEPNNLEYLSQLAKHHVLNCDHLQALYYAEIAANKEKELSLASVLTIDTLGVIYSQIGIHDKAVRLFTKAIKLNQQTPTIYFNLGTSLKFIGDFKSAKEAFENAISLAPNYCKAHAALSSLGGLNKKHNHIPQLKELFKRVHQVEDKLHIGHALAREYEAIEDFDSAFHYLDTAKKLKLQQIQYSIQDDTRLFQCIEKHFKQAQITLKSGFKSAEPIFVVGMPRTGTTLVERIISQHSDVTSAGELQNFGLLFKKMAQTRTNLVLDPETIRASKCINFKALGKSYIESTRAITGKTAKFVDKMPLNVLYVGFILQTLPKAKIICLDRNPLDTIVSNFRQLFAVNQSYYSYSYSLETTAQYYQLFKRLTSLWSSMFPANFYTANYEKLVNDPIPEACKIIEFCDLSWQKQCVEIERNKSPIATASAIQVRNPINNRSVGNWQNYDAYLDKVKTMLAQ